MNSVYKLDMVVKRGKAECVIHGIVTSMVDLWRMDSLDDSEFSGKRLVNLCDNLLLQMEFKNFLLGDFLATNKFHPHETSIILEKVKTVEAVRKFMTPYKPEISGQEQIAVDMHWRVAAKPSAVLVCDTVEDFCYTANHLGSFATASKASKDAPSLAEYSIFKVQTYQVLELLEKDSRVYIRL